ncbi:MAG: cadmium-translocating P-type ATPase [Bacteroidales bacterium]|nr:cadmium-translocating P-type ATPase [Bacteroidales bacterium]
MSDHHHKEQENGQEHCHCHHEEASTKERLLKIGLASLLLIATKLVESFTSLSEWQLLLIYLIPYLIVGWETLTEAFEGITHGQALDEHFLMSIATLGALAIGFLPGAEPQMAEAVFVMLFYQIGELFEGIAEDRSRRSIAHLTALRPETAHVEKDGALLDTDPGQVSVGDIIVVRPGERIPLDGSVVEGVSSLDTVALTGESLPRSVKPGEEVYSGCVNMSGVLRIKVEKAFGASTVMRILDLVENAADNKSKNERFITRFARIYTPVVVAAALLLAVVPVLAGGQLSVWLYRALLFLVVSCPCALVISVPLAFFGGIGGASRQGILVKGGNWMEVLAKTDTIVFDKTGTLTQGVFEVTAVHPEKITAEGLLHLAAHVERYSDHPIAVSLKNAYPDEQDGCEIDQVEEVAGQGIRARVNRQSICVGNTRMMQALGIRLPECQDEGSVVHVAIDGEYAGHIVISDRIREDAYGLVDRLHSIGIRQAVMLTGDHGQTAAAVAKALRIDEYHAELLPQDKVELLEKLVGEKKGRQTVAFVGDGINDAPVLARADVGIAMGGLGSQSAVEAADVVLMDDRPSKIVTAVGIARKTLRIARENTWFAIGVKVSVLLLAVAGLANMGMAVFADVGVTVLAILNAMRCLHK